MRHNNGNVQAVAAWNVSVGKWEEPLAWHTVAPAVYTAPLFLWLCYWSLLMCDISCFRLWESYFVLERALQVKTNKLAQHRRSFSRDVLLIYLQGRIPV